MLQHTFASHKQRELTPELIVISELLVNTTIFGWLFTAEVVQRKTNTGKLFLDLKLRDQRGSEIIARFSRIYLDLQCRRFRFFGLVFD